MTLGFIVTTYNILPYIDRCLESLAACARAGDRVIVIDDGSADGTAERVESWLKQGRFAAGVTVQSVLFGANTAGGVGIAGNTGLTRLLADTECEAVFFVDGDDWLEPEGFQACRRAFEASGADILLGNYAEYDASSGRHRRPADARTWARVPQLRQGDTEAARRLALSMIAVPWRKFYRADFLRRHGLRFPEGDFFFEDNPFHWEVCLKAESIAFHDRILCQHRINRPGQTMASTGTELIAFFDHYARIRALVPVWEDSLAEAALSWLLGNMSWHVARLRPAAFWPYATRAAQTLAAVPERIWTPVHARFAEAAIGGVAEALRRGDTAGVVGLWMQAAQSTALEQAILPRIAHLSARIDALDAALPEAAAALRPPLESIGAQVSALHEIARFQALLALPAPPEDLSDTPPAKDDPRT